MPQITFNTTGKPKIPPSPSMINYMMILFNDCGFTENSKFAWLVHTYGRTIKYLDDLSFSEGLEVIKRLKEIRGDGK
jgi:hypothetical protein